ncbi:MAG: hypothetical protein AAB380_03935 [Verrucomicrobiota bacterium]
MKTFSGIFAAWFVLSAAFPADKAAGGEAPSRYEQPQMRAATIYEANSNKKHILYKFKRTVTQSGPVAKVLREFSYPDGKVAARERIVYDGDNLMSYELEELQIHARGAVKLRRDGKAPGKGQIVFDYVTGTNSSGKTNANTESLRPDTLVGDMIAPFLVAHWNDLIKGQAVKCRLIVASRAETVGFTFEKHAESTWQGKPVVSIKMSPSSFIIAALVDPLYFTMEKDGEHRVLQCDGRTTPKIKDRNKWKDLDAVTVFDWD